MHIFGECYHPPLAAKQRLPSPTAPHAPPFDTASKNERRERRRTPRRARRGEALTSRTKYGKKKFPLRSPCRVVYFRCKISSLPSHHVFHGSKSLAGIMQIRNKERRRKTLYNRPNPPNNSMPYFSRTENLRKKNLNEHFAIYRMSSLTSSPL